MKTNKTTFGWLKTAFCLLVWICFIVSSALYSGVYLQKKKEKVQEKKERTSLVRKDLLKSTKEPLPPIKRNIFTRQRMTIPGGGDNSVLEDFRRPGQKQSADSQPAEAEQVRIDVKYIGYVQSGEKVVALIILGGNTYAVESGDVLEMGVSIGEITPDDMEIIDRGSEPIRIDLEGEKP
jgi:hypothetical protein